MKVTRQKLKEDFLTCVVCHEVFKDPVTLHCGHTLCSQCVTSFLKTQSQSIANCVIPCPSCRGLTKVPDPCRPAKEWVGQLKTGFFVKSLVEALASAPGEGERLCSVCLEDGNTEVSSSYCSECMKDYCVACSKWHTKILRSHKTKPSHEAAVGKGRSSTRVCPEHAQSPMDMMCEDCAQVLCQKCCIVYHRRCESVITLEQAVSKTDAFLEKQLGVLDQDISKLKTGLNTIQTKMETLVTSAMKAEEDLDTACAKVISKVVDKQGEIKEKIARARQSGVEEYEADVKVEMMKLEAAKQKQALIRQALKSDILMDHVEMLRICTPTQVEYQPAQRRSRVSRIDYNQGEIEHFIDLGDLKL